MAGTNYLVLVTLVSFAKSLPLEDDSKHVGSEIHESKLEVPSDLLAAATKYVEQTFKDKDDDGFFKSHDTKGEDGYKKLGKFLKKDGDTYGFEEHSLYGKKGGGDKNKNLQYHHSTSYDIDDTKKKRGAQSDKPSFREWHYESSNKTPSKHFKSVMSDDDDEAVDDSLAHKSFGNSKKIKRSRKPHPDVEISGPIVGPRFQSLGDISPAGIRRQQQHQQHQQSKKIKREKKDPQISATDEFNYYDEGDDPSFAGFEDGEEEPEEDAEYEEYPNAEADDYY